MLFIMYNFILFFFFYHPNYMQIITNYSCYICKANVLMYSYKSNLIRICKFGFQINIYFEMLSLYIYIMCM